MSRSALSSVVRSASAPAPLPFKAFSAPRRAPFNSAAVRPPLVGRSLVSSATSVRVRDTRASLCVPIPRFIPASARGMKTLDFGGTKEVVFERSDFPRDKLIATFQNDTLAMIGYGPQGRGQALNARDQGLNIVVGVRKDGNSWEKAVAEGWIPGKTLFPIEEACKAGTIIMYLLSDAAQKTEWTKVKPYLTKGKTLCFAHGFSVVYKDLTNVVPPENIDVILVAPKGSGTSLRTLFEQGRGINSSVAVHQDVSGKAKERTVALAVAVGSGYMYETTFEKEVYSDLTGERGVLMGAIQGAFLAQYEVLRANGHSPSEAFNETVEEATQSLYPLIGQNGMDWMYSNCSTTAQRGALDWYRPFYRATKPVFEELYEKVKEGSETARSLAKNSSPSYRRDLQEELAELQNHEMWRAGATVRSLRPENAVTNKVEAVERQHERASATSI